MSDNPFDPSDIADLPEEVAMFPLPAATVLPGTQLPLNIFEPRYLNMIMDALGAARMFAMVQPDPRHAGSDPAVVYPVGCVGRIIAFNETGDGRLLLSLQGVCRFRILEELPLTRGYRRVRADYQGFASDLSPDGAFELDRTALRDAMGDYLEGNGIRIDWDALEKMADAHMVDFLSTNLPLGVEEKQLLVEAGTTADRVEALMAATRISAGGGEASPTRH